MKIKSLLLNPKNTARVIIAGVASIGLMFGGIAAALLPVDSAPALAHVKPYADQVIIVAGGVAIACQVLAAMGRSIISFIDNPTGGANAERT